MRVVFGECEFDSGQRVVCRHGRVMPLSPKALQLLELLLDRRPEAVAKTEILERLWPETFVSDASLHNLVAEVRAALGDSPRAARYIRTVPRYGYAFQADARPAPAATLPASQPQVRGSSRGVASGFCPKARILLVVIATVPCASIPPRSLVDTPASSSTAQRARSRISGARTALS